MRAGIREVLCELMRAQPSASPLALLTVMFVASTVEYRLEHWLGITPLRDAK